MIYEITDDTFKAEVVNSAAPCVILFTGAWCGVCHEMLPRLEELAGEYGDKVKFCSVDTDKEKGLRIKFAVAVLPYLVYTADGMQTPLFDELVTTDKLRERIDFMLEGGAAPTTRPL